MTRYVTWFLYLAVVPVLISLFVVNNVSANDTHKASAPSRIQHRIHHRLKRISYHVDRIGHKINRKVNQIQHRVRHDVSHRSNE